MTEDRKRGGVIEAQIVEVRRQPQFRQDVEIVPGTGQKETRVDKVGLAFTLGRSQVGKDSVLGIQRRKAAAGDKWQRLSDPVARIRAGKLGVFHDRIETRSMTAPGIATAA